jgi:hypothetical protein
MQAGGAVRSADALIRFSIHPHSAHSNSACASTVFTASSCKSGEPKEQGN